MTFHEFRALATRETSLIVGGATSSSRLRGPIPTFTPCSALNVFEWCACQLNIAVTKPEVFWQTLWTWIDLTPEANRIPFSMLQPTQY